MLHLCATEAIYREDVYPEGISVDQGEDGEAAAHEYCEDLVSDVPRIVVLTEAGGCLIES